MIANGGRDNRTSLGARGSRLRGTTTLSFFLLFFFFTLNEIISLGKLERRHRVG